MTAFLPQNDPHAFARAIRLRFQRRRYEYSYTHVSPLAMVERVPFKDEFSLKWLRMVGQRVITALANRAELEVGTHARDHHLSKLSTFKEMIDIGDGAIFGIREMVCDMLKFDGRFGAASSRPEALEDYADLFRAIELPPVHHDYQDDEVFAEMRVAGPNPVMLRQMIDLDGRMALTDAHLRVVAPGDSLDSARAEGRLFVADYVALDGAEQGDFPDGPKHAYAPIAVFVVHKATRKLLPFAIQCQQTPASDNPIFTPADGHNWLIAKTIVEVADGCMHEAFVHLGRTHLLMEPFVVTSFRQLAHNHPLRLLLQPHFEGTLAINEAAWQHLIADKGAVDKLMGTSINASRGLAVDAVQSANFGGLALPLTLAERGVDDVDRLPHYPYRDDSRLYWDAIRKWVASYVDVYYTSATDVQQDTELQAWHGELASEAGGRLSGLPATGPQTTAEVVDIVTLVIFTCSVQHAAVNFPQYDLMSYVPNMPLAGYSTAPTSTSGATEQDYLDTLPPLDMAELQMEVGFLLGTVHYTQLGQYGRRHFDDARVDGALQTFQNDVAAIGQTINERNTERRPYRFLEPDGIPQSINI